MRIDKTGAYTQISAVNYGVEVMLAVTCANRPCRSDIGNSAVFDNDTGIAQDLIFGIYGKCHFQVLNYGFHFRYLSTMQWPPPPMPGRPARFVALVDFD